MTASTPLAPLFRAAVVARQICAIDSTPVRRAPIGKVLVPTIADPRIASGNGSRGAAPYSQRRWVMLRASSHECSAGTILSARQGDADGFDGGFGAGFRGSMCQPCVMRRRRVCRASALRRRKKSDGRDAASLPCRRLPLWVPGYCNCAVMPGAQGSSCGLARGRELPRKLSTSPMNRSLCDAKRQWGAPSNSIRVLFAIPLAAARPAASIGTVLSPVP